MREMFLNFEHSAVSFNPTVLLSLGILSLAAGLVMWLAGMALKRLFLFITGAAIGAVLGYFFIGRKMISTVGLASLFAVIAAFLDKFVVTILAAVLAVVIAFSIMAWHYEAAVSVEPVLEGLPAPLSEEQTLDFLNTTLLNFIHRADDACRQMPYYNWLIIPLLIVIFIAGGIFLWHLICAWLWGTLGTILIFAGMISLLLYKGSTPITFIFQNSPYFITIFLAMMMLGAIVQFVLFHFVKAGPRKEKTKADIADDQPKPRSWRDL